MKKSVINLTQSDRGRRSGVTGDGTEADTAWVRLSPGILFFQTIAGEQVHRMYLEKSYISI